MGLRSPVPQSCGLRTTLTAYQLSTAGRPIHVSVSSPGAALSTLMLLAERARPEDRIAVAPEFARDRWELAARIELHLPAAIASEFDARIDEAAVIELALDSLLDSFDGTVVAATGEGRSAAPDPSWIAGIGGSGSARATLLPLRGDRRPLDWPDEVDIDPDPIAFPTPAPIRHPAGAATGPGGGHRNARVADATGSRTVFQAYLPPAALALQACDPLIRDGLDALYEAVDRVHDVDEARWSTPFRDLLDRV